MAVETASDRGANADAYVTGHHIEDRVFRMVSPRVGVAARIDERPAAEVGQDRLV